MKFLKSVSFHGVCKMKIRYGAWMASKCDEYGFEVQASLLITFMLPLPRISWNTLILGCCKIAIFYMI